LLFTNGFGGGILFFTQLKKLGFGSMAFGSGGKVSIQFTLALNSNHSHSAMWFLSDLLALSFSLALTETGSCEMVWL
jgi:hypothetical protein